MKLLVRLSCGVCMTKCWAVAVRRFSMSFVLILRRQAIFPRSFHVQSIQFPKVNLLRPNTFQWSLLKGIAPNFQWPFDQIANSDICFAGPLDGEQWSRRLEAIDPGNERNTSRVGMTHIALKRTSHWTVSSSTLQQKTSKKTHKNQPHSNRWRSARSTVAPWLPKRRLTNDAEKCQGRPYRFTGDKKKNVSWAGGIKDYVNISKHTRIGKDPTFWVTPRV